MSTSSPTPTPTPKTTAARGGSVREPASPSTVPPASAEATSVSESPDGKNTPAASSEARRRAAVILEVLAGVRSATEGAEALKISVNHYYLLERQALAGLVAGCEPRPKGKQPDPRRQLEALEQALLRSQRECQRQAALVRATQRAVGLPATPPPEVTSSTARRNRKRKPTKGGKASTRRRAASVRALRMSRVLAEKALADESSSGLQLKSPEDHERKLLDTEGVEHDATRT
jgi:hypothetical protein